MTAPISLLIHRAYLDAIRRPRDIAEDRTLGDTTTLADPNVVANLTGEWQAAVARAAREEEE